jgi:hypothetical protein
VLVQESGREREKTSSPHDVMGLAFQLRPVWRETEGDKMSEALDDDMDFDGMVKEPQCDSSLWK